MWYTWQRSSFWDTSLCLEGGSVILRGRRVLTSSNRALTSSSFSVFCACSNNPSTLLTCSSTEPINTPLNTADSCQLLYWWSTLILTSLRLILEIGTVRMLLREPRASVQTSSTKTPTSWDNVLQFSFSSNSSCQWKELVITSHQLDTLYINRSVLCVSNLLQAVGCHALNLRGKCVCLRESLGLHLLHQLQICFHSIFRRHAEHKLVLNHCGL